MKRSISATELSKMEFCEFNVIQKQILNKSQRDKMQAGIKAHNHFEKTIHQLGNTRINIPTQQTAKTKTTTQRTFTKYFKVALVVVTTLFAIGYIVITAQS